MKHIATRSPRKRFWSIAIASFLMVFSLTILPSHSHPHLSINSQVGVNNIGVIKIGMTKEEAEAVSGVKLIPHPEHEQRYPSEFCYYLYPDNNLDPEVAFMMEKNRIVRVDIQHQQITTISGAKVGDTEKEIKAIYPNIEVTPGFYGGKYLIYRPQDSAYKNYLLLFEAFPPRNRPENTHRVRTFRVGYEHEVAYLVEGCS